MRYRVLCNDQAIGEIELVPTPAGQAFGSLIAAPAAEPVIDLVASGWRIMRNYFTPATREQQAEESRRMAAFNGLRFRLETLDGASVDAGHFWATIAPDGRLRLHTQFDV